MAVNMVNANGNQIEATIASKASGDPALVGQMPGVCLTATDGAGRTVVKTDGIFSMSVRGVNDAGNVAVNNGDILYYLEADTPKLGKKATAGVRFGYAWSPSVAPGAQLIASGATATITVKIGY
jgi:hypothetical protein